MIPGVAASETGGAQTGARRAPGFGPRERPSSAAERSWKDRPERVRAP